MNIRTVKKPEKRMESISLSNLGIQSYGYNNLYPQEIMKLVASSESASACMDRYISFIQGNGFLNVDFASTVINKLGQTPDDLLPQITSDIANCRGFALHINYNLLCDPVEIYVVPFENCRLCETDDAGYMSKIAVHPDWTGKTKRNGKILRVSKENIDYIDIYNPRKDVIAAQIEAAGGIENYKGQIIWVSDAGPQTYPKPVHDAVVSQMSTEEGLGNIANRNTRNNFLPSGMLVTRKGQNPPTGADDGENYQDDDVSIGDAVAAVQGDMNANKIIQAEIENDEEMPQFVNIQGANYDKDFTVTTTTASQKIYAAFNQEIWYRIMNGSIGFSSDIMTDAYEYSSSVTSKERRMVERTFERVFKHWPTVINNSDDYSIQPMKFISSETETSALISLYEKNMVTLNTVLEKLGMPEKKDGDVYLSDVESTPLAVKLGVGGTQALQGILSDPNMSDTAKVGALEVLFSVAPPDANKLVYGTSTPDNAR